MVPTIQLIYMVKGEMLTQELHPWYKSLRADSKIQEKTALPALGEESYEDP